MSLVAAEDAFSSLSTDLMSKWRGVMDGGMFRRLACLAALLTVVALTQPVQAFEHFPAMNGP